MGKCNLNIISMTKYFLILLVIGFSCNSSDDRAYILEPHEGFIQVAGGNIWYKVIGNGPGIPLVALHGGPGSRSCKYVAPFSLLAGERPIIIFDQLRSVFRFDQTNDGINQKTGPF